MEGRGIGTIRKWALLCVSAAMLIAARGAAPEKAEPAASVTAGVKRTATVIPGGNLVGVMMTTEGLMYVGASDLGQTASPARVAGLKAGDIIQRVNGQSVNDAETMGKILADGGQANLLINRNGKRLTLTVTPQIDPRDGQYRIGAWVRNQSAGVGTLTYIDPATGIFGALAHAIEDPDTQTVLPVNTGAIFSADVTAVEKGKRGQPGEIGSDFFESADMLGTIRSNTQKGIFGVYTNANAYNPLFPDGIAVAAEHELRTGGAQILSTVDHGGPALFDCEIVSVDLKNDESRNLAIKVTDPTLIRQTGGIVQGMSGSPIIQNGKLIGAVTHVLISDPTRGYGVSMERMRGEEPTARADAA